MSKTLFKFGLLMVVILLAGLTYQVAVTQNGNSRYFSETGHTVDSEFLTFYQSISNPELVYGYPLTDRIDSGDGLIVQYFQKARFELHPEAEEGKRVQLTPLGSRLYQNLTPAPFSISKNLAACRTFSTGMDVCYSFLAFFDKHGGVAQFGNPISEIEERGGRYVQYFEFARFEWHPDGIEVDLSQEVQLTFLGEQYFEQLKENPFWKLSPNGNFIPEKDSLRVYAFPVRAVVSPQELQSIYVIVKDQNLSPVRNLGVTVELTYASGLSDFMTLEPTNGSGYTSGDIPFTAGDAGSGMVEVKVTAANSFYQETTRTSFRIAP